jgi:dTDP-4-amino-4,6-dideoxy-D-galactose acyltransferase
MKLSVTTKSALQPAGELLTWDGDFWGIRIGRANTSDIDKWAKENTVGCICLLINADEPGQIQAAEERGFRFMDVRVTLARATQGRLAAVRTHTPEDVDALAAIARVSHRITRFYADPRFPDERCDDLYETWIRSSCAGWADTVLIAGDKQGYCTVHVSGDEGSIGLIAVRQDSRGKGLGMELVDGAIDWCFTKGLDRITVVTQGRNTAALRLFQRCGFLIEKTEIWMSKWYQ